MKTRIVFSKGRWISVTLPVGRDPSWTVSSEWIYANAWAAAVRSGLTEERAEQVGEAIVLKHLYNGITYDKHLSRDIERCFTKEEN
jgi:hypothetical protein